MSRKTTLPLILAVALAGCGKGDDADNAAPPAVTSAAPREAPLIDGAAKTIGKVVLSEDPTGTTVKVDISELGVGRHGLHLHEVGNCTLPDFKSAGAHLNPEGKQHGRDNPAGAHLGDLANLTVNDDGTAHTDFLVDGTSIAQLVDADGVSLVVHADPDDYRTDPSGNSGDRIACAAFN